jgi:hypothetical protein
MLAGSPLQRLSIVLSARAWPVPLIRSLRFDGYATVTPRKDSPSDR